MGVWFFLCLFATHITYNQNAFRNSSSRMYRPWVSNIFVPKGHTGYSGLVRGPQVDKQQKMVRLTAQIIVQFFLIVHT